MTSLWRAERESKGGSRFALGMIDEKGKGNSKGKCKKGKGNSKGKCKKGKGNSKGKCKGNRRSFDFATLRSG
jgi:hypothetical protein